MRLPSLPASAMNRSDYPCWPPLLAAKGPGSKSDVHAHHALHFVFALEGELRVKAGSSDTWTHGAGVLTAPDHPHAIDAEGAEVLLVFLDPESREAEALCSLMAGPIRLLSNEERVALLVDADPGALLGARGAEWLQRAVLALGGRGSPIGRTIHPRVRRLLKLLQNYEVQTHGQPSLEELAQAVGLSPGRLMHVFTQSIGLPLRPYLAWLKLQRSASAMVSGASLTQAAQIGGFADSAHMSRTFRRMFGVPPSALQSRARE